jgi:DUF917 family protein
MNGGEYQRLYDAMGKLLGRKIDAFMPMEAGGVNSLLPIAAAARIGLPLVDADGMGRAFPELQMVTFTLAGVKAVPMALTDEKGNTVIFSTTVTNKWTEDLARAITMTCGGSVSVSLYPMDGKTVKQYGVRDIVTRSEKLGKALCSLKEEEGAPEENFLKACGAVPLFKGKIVDVERETRAGFNFGRVIFDGIGAYKARKAFVEFQNENLLCSVDNTIRATAPDLICMVDTETFSPIPTDAVKYGKRVLIAGLPCFPAWRTPEGLALVGPRYFHCDTDYIPVEIRAKGVLNV